MLAEETYTLSQWDENGTVAVFSGEDEELGRVRVEVIDGNVVITVEREDESRFGPVSLVVV